MVVKFTGKFRDLKPMGFKFHRLYARNYKVYEQEDMWIWVGGGDVRFKDLPPKHFAIVFDMILNDQYPLYEEDLIYEKISPNPFFSKGDPKMCIVDRENDIIISHEEFLKKWKKKFATFGLIYIQFAQSGRFKELIIHKRHIKLIKELNERNMLCLKK